jgi:hypothetical protein
LSSPLTPTGTHIPQAQATIQPGRPVWVPGKGWVTDGSAPQVGQIQGYNPSPPPRRSWFRVLLIAVVILILLCCASSAYFSTSRGTAQLNRASTWAAEQKK